MKKLLAKLAWVLEIGVYVHRLFDGCNDLRYEILNVKNGFITPSEFIKQIIPTMKYHLSGEFQKRIAEIYKEEHPGLDQEEE